MLSHVWLFVTLWTVAGQGPLSMKFSRQEYYSGLPCSPPGDLPNPGIKPSSLTSPALAGMFFTISATWEALKCPEVGTIWGTTMKRPVRLEQNERKVIEGKFREIMRSECWSLQAIVSILTLTWSELGNHWRVLSLWAQEGSLWMLYWE